MSAQYDLILRPNYPEEEPAFKLEMPPELVSVLESNIHVATIVANAGESIDELNQKLDDANKLAYEAAAASLSMHPKIEEIGTNVDEMQAIVDETSVHVQDVQQELEAFRNDVEPIVRETAENVSQLFDRVMEIHENVRALEKAIMWLCSQQNSPVSSEFSSD